MSTLKEIVLTKDKGFVIKEDGSQVEIICGVDGLGVIETNKDDKIKAIIEHGIKVFHAKRLPEGINGYIIHGKVSKDYKERLSIEEQEVTTLYSAVKYKERKW